MDGYDDLTALAAYSRVPVSGGELHTAGLPELNVSQNAQFQNGLVRGDLLEPCEFVDLVGLDRCQDLLRAQERKHVAARGRAGRRGFSGGGRRRHARS